MSNELEGPAFAELRAIRVTGEKTHAAVTSLTFAVSGLADRVIAGEHVQAMHAKWIVDEQQAREALAAKVAAIAVPVIPAQPNRRRAFLDRVVLTLLTLLSIFAFSAAIYFSTKGP